MISNTSNYASNAAAGVIHTGTPVDADTSNPNAKIYQGIPESRTHLPDGREIVFRGGQFATSDPEVQAFLDTLVASSAAPVYLERDTMAEQFAQAAEGAAISASQISETNPQLLKAASPEMRAATAAALKPARPDTVAATRV